MATLLQSFNQALPVFPGDMDTSDIKSASSTSTANAAPPKFWKVRTYNQWNNYADTVLSAVGNALGARLPELEDSMFLKVEADVIRASILYLLHPVNQALSARHPGEIRCNSETTNNKKGRCDITYSRAQGPDWIPFAVIEIKRQGAIRGHEFTASRTSDANHSFHQALNDPNSRGSLFNGNSYFLMQQASHYAVNENTQFVALFDWDTLFLNRFSNLSPAVDVGDWSYGTLIRGRAQMRRALLGFLEKAHEVSLGQAGSDDDDDA